MLRFLILSGYFELVMYLQVSGKLNQYINIHYSYLAYISMVLSFILAVVQLIVLDEADEGSLAFVRSSSQGSQHRSLGLSSPHGALGANSDLGCQYRVS
mgnify:CR=1 FL=1